MITTAIILAAGSGTRMWPFAEVRNKCAIPVGGTPNIRRIAEHLIAIGIHNLVIVVGEQAGSVRAALLGVSATIDYVEQSRPTGTATAALLGLRRAQSDGVLVVYGDICTTGTTLQRVRDTWGTGGTAAVALVQRLEPPQRPQDWICAHCADGVLKGLDGHSRSAEYRLGGVFVLDQRMRPFLEANPGIMSAVGVGGMPPVEAELAQSLQQALEHGLEIATVEPDGFLTDMDKPWHILEANYRHVSQAAALLTEHRIHPSARIHDGAELNGFVALGPKSVIGNRVVVNSNLIVGARTKIVNGAIIGGIAQIGNDNRVSDYCLVDGHTVIGHRCVVGHGAEMSGVQFDGSYLWHYCEIFGVVGQSVDIGAATVCGTLRFDDGDAEQRVRGRREVPEWGANATYFGDFSRTGVNVITQPGTKIGSYSCVGAGVVLYGDLPSRTLRLLKQETVDRPWGPERYGW